MATMAGMVRAKQFSIDEDLVTSEILPALNSVLPLYPLGTRIKVGFKPRSSETHLDKGKLHSAAILVEVVSSTARTELIFRIYWIDGMIQIVPVTENKPYIPPEHCLMFSLR